MTDYIAAIESVFREFKIGAKVTGSARGPAVTRYEVTLGTAVRIEKVARLQQQLTYATAAKSVRILAPIPGKTAVGIELPNAERDTIRLDDVPIPHDAHPLTVGLGKTVDGEMLTVNLGEMPHLLVAGTTGSGKSTFINAALVSLLRRATPDQVQLMLIDPKQVELTPYEGIAHLIQPVVTETEDAILALKSLVEIMELRYTAMREAGVRNIVDLKGYPYIVAVVDELADLMLASKAVEPLLVRLCQKARAAGIHMLLATQRPSVDVVTGLLKANTPSRLAFATSSQTDSRVVLDENGAETLLGMGDGLYKPVGCRAAIRVQGAYVSDAEVAAVVKEWTGGGVRADEGVSESDTKTPQMTLVLRMVDELIASGGDAIKRVDKYLTALNSPRVKRDDKMLMYFDSPIELSKAGIALDQIICGLREIKEGVGIDNHAARV